MKRHALIALPAGILPVLDMPDGLRQIWKTEIYQQIAYNINIRCAEAELPILVPYVILKGTAAAKYYPHPEYRTMGDIDVMTSRENFDTAFNQLIQKGYKPVNDLYREPGFMKDGIKVELHRSFALLNDVGQAESLDNLIMKNINSTHFLPDNINGLVILEHISQHLEQGIGWRQIIDWMMFADHFLSDDHWPDFEDMAKSIGLRELAVHVTRMCEIYLGLLSRKWCSNADEGICHRLMVYVFQCGNFGTKRETNKGKTERVINYSRTPIAALKNLQKNGLVNWKMAQKYSILRPFAWIYQACRYIRKGLMHKNAIGDLREAYHGNCLIS